MHPVLSVKARRVYVGNLPQGIGLQPKVLQEFFNTALVSAGLVVGEGVPINDVWISSEGRYAFLEMRSPQEATNAMKLDGISLSVPDLASHLYFVKLTLVRQGMEFLSKFQGRTTMSHPLMPQHHMLFLPHSPVHLQWQHLQPRLQFLIPLLRLHRDSWRSQTSFVQRISRIEENADI